MPLTKIKKAKPKKEKKPEAHWNALVAFYFSWYQFRLNAPAPFLGSAPRDLKNIVITLREIVEGKEQVWDKEIAKRMLLAFLDFSLRNENVGRCNRQMFLASVYKNRNLILEDIRQSKIKKQNHE